MPAVQTLILHSLGINSAELTMRITGFFLFAFLPKVCGDVYHCTNGEREVSFQSIVPINVSTKLHCAVVCSSPIRNCHAFNWKPTFGVDNDGACEFFEHLYQDAYVIDGSTASYCQLQEATSMVKEEVIVASKADEKVPYMEENTVTSTEATTVTFNEDTTTVTSTEGTTTVTSAEGTTTVTSADGTTTVTSAEGTTTVTSAEGTTTVTSAEGTTTIMHTEPTTTAANRSVFVVIQSTSYSQSKSKCLQSTSQSCKSVDSSCAFATVKDANKQALVEKRLGTCTDCISMWVSLKKAKNTTAWVWDDGMVIDKESYTNWAVPDDGFISTADQCVYLDRTQSYQWMTASCSKLYTTLCDIIYK